jgi:hypothetical protein
MTVVIITIYDVVRDEDGNKTLRKTMALDVIDIGNDELLLKHIRDAQMVRPGGYVFIGDRIYRRVRGGWVKADDRDIAKLGSYFL